MQNFLQTHDVIISADRTNSAIGLSGDSVTVYETNAPFILTDNSGSRFDIDRACRVESINGERFDRLVLVRPEGVTGEIRVKLAVGAGIRFIDGRTQVSASLFGLRTDATLPAPLSWRLVPHIRHELIAVPGAGSKHVWTEEPGRGTVYGTGAAIGNELFGDSVNASICLAIANPRVAKRRVTLVRDYGRWDGTTPDNGTVAGAPAAGLFAYLTDRVDSFAYSKPKRQNFRRISSGVPVDIDGGSAIFFTADDLIPTKAYAFEVEEWFYPATIDLPATLGDWPGSGSPASWGKMIASAFANVGTLASNGQTPSPDNPGTDSPTPDTGTPDTVTPDTVTPDTDTPGGGDTGTPGGGGTPGELDLYFDESADGDSPPWHVETGSQIVDLVSGATITVTSTTRPLIALVVKGTQYSGGSAFGLPAGNASVSVIYEGAPVTTEYDPVAGAPQAVVHVTGFNV